VSRRFNEIGVRMALGARAGQVLRMVLGEAMSLAFAGVGVGLCLALLLTRLLNSLLFGLKPTDSLTLAGAGLLVRRCNLSQLGACAQIVPRSTGAGIAT